MNVHVSEHFRGHGRAHFSGHFSGNFGAPGLAFDRQSVLLGRALESLAEGPRSTQALARRVFGFRTGPEGVAARLVYDLLGSERRVSVDPAGVWRRVAASAEDISLGSMEFVVVDVETTGGSPTRGDRVIEFAAVGVHGGQVTGSFSSLVNPGCSVSPFISRLTGITSVMLADAPAFSDISDTVQAWLEGRVFVAHNAKFDWGFVAAEMSRARTLLPVGPSLCTVRLTRRALPGLRRRGLDAVADYYGVEIYDRHRAEGDALATAEILIRLLAEASRAGVSTWEGLQLWLAGRPRGRRSRIDETRGGRAKPCP